MFVLTGRRSWWKCHCALRSTYSSLTAVIYCRVQHQYITQTEECDKLQVCIWIAICVLEYIYTVMNLSCAILEEVEKVNTKSLHFISWWAIWKQNTGLHYRTFIWLCCVNTSIVKHVTTVGHKAILQPLLADVRKVWSSSRCPNHLRRFARIRHLQQPSAPSMPTLEQLLLIYHADNCILSLCVYGADHFQAGVPRIPVS